MKVFTVGFGCEVVVVTAGMAAIGSPCLRHVSGNGTTIERRCDVGSGCPAERERVLQWEGNGEPYALFAIAYFILQAKYLAKSVPFERT